MQSNPSKASESRRRLVRGSLAAPVVLTVSSASAASVTSFRRCLAKLNNAPAGPFFTSDATIDNWLRKSVPVVQLKYQGTSDWYYLDPGTDHYVRLSAPAVSTGLTQWTPGLVPTGAQSSRWALVWVDSQQGSMYSLMQVQQPIGYQASTKSCYTSLLRG